MTWLIELLVLATGLPTETVQAAVGGYLLRLLGALTGIAMLGVAMQVGAWWMGIKLRRAIDKVESSPVAFAILITGCTLAAAWVFATSLG